MASILLSAVAQTAVQSVAGAVLGGGKSRHREGARLESLSVQTSTYGEFIPLVYGRARLAGNVIWARPMKEVATTTTTSQGKGGGSASASSTDYSYFATLAIAICEGEVNSIDRVWADAKQLDLSQGTYRFYAGNETQLPDPLIESFEGLGNTPAYRGLSYIVIEDFPLGDYGNRIPNFTFEVRRNALWEDMDGQPLEHLIKEMVLIPGSGEFVYDTQLHEKISGEEVGGEFAQSGRREPINQHTGKGKTNALVALDQLEEACPNVEWVALVINWFGTSMDLPSCDIVPGVEFAAGGGTTSPELWSVGNYTRASAHIIAYVDGSPRYGGTPDDESLLRLCNELIARGKKILCLPMFLMDVADKPWRGRLTGNAADVAHFFTKSTGYNEFILHYANLLKTKIDAIAIGSELVGLTSIHNGASINRQFPAVGQLVSLAAAVKGIVGAAVKVTYAADWSEYHHAEGGWYHMDALWGSPHIDVIGIDAYFPLTDSPQSELGYGIEVVQDGWESGEGYDWYYTDEARTITAPLAPEYAWKNIAWFWENMHINPDGNSTAWTAQSKKIWFTEYGFPSVDGATNQPNVFYDPSSSESFFPRHSKGRIDFRAQRTGIAATIAQWQNSPMVERTFLWTWDARPFPYWPDLMQIWRDGGVWITGHWVQGKLGMSSLAAIVFDLCQRAGIQAGYIDVAQLADQVDGFIIKKQDSARQWIELLMDAYFFDAVEAEGQLCFRPRSGTPAASITWDQLAATSSLEMPPPLRIERLQELELPQSVEVNYLSRLSQYQTGTQASHRQITSSRDVESLNLPIVMDAQRAKMIADIALYQRWLARIRYVLDVPVRYSDLQPADVIEVTDANQTQHVMRIESIRFSKEGRLRIEAMAEDAANYDFYSPPASGLLVAEPVTKAAQTHLVLLDLPLFPTDSDSEAVLRAAMVDLGAGWSGAALYRSDDSGANYGELLRSTQAATIGTALQVLGEGARNRFDESNTLLVLLMGGGELLSVTNAGLLNGANLALVGDEIVQFRTAELIAPNKYRISGFLRGRLGTESAMAHHSAGEPFVLLNSALQKQPAPEALWGLPRDYKAVSFGQTLGSAAAQTMIYQAKALRPYAPVHLCGERDGSGNLTIHWIRRTRSGGQWRDGVDAALSESSECYEIDILDGTNVVRTLSSISSQITYAAAQQIVDFGALQSSVSMRVYQLSERVGRGEGAQAVV